MPSQSPWLIILDETTVEYQKHSECPGGCYRYVTENKHHGRCRMIFWYSCCILLGLLARLVSFVLFSPSESHGGTQRELRFRLRAELQRVWWRVSTKVSSTINLVWRTRAQNKQQWSRRMGEWAPADGVPLSAVLLEPKGGSEPNFKPSISPRLYYIKYRGNRIMPENLLWGNFMENFTELKNEYDTVVSWCGTFSLL